MVKNEHDNHLIGYSDRFAARPGQKVSFYVSTSETEFRMRTVKLGLAPGEGRHLYDRPLDGVATRGQRGRRQRTTIGSFAEIQNTRDLIDLNSSWCFSCWVYPTKLDNGHPQSIITLLPEEYEQRCELLINKNGRIELIAAPCSGNGVEAKEPIKVKRWYRLLAGYDHSNGSIMVAVDTLASKQKEFCRSIIEESMRWQPCKTIMFGASYDSSGSYRHFYNGRLDEVKLFLQAPADVSDSDVGHNDAQNEDNLAAFWDFGAEVNSTRVVDRGPFGWHGKLVNMPTRGVSGHRWTGEYLDFEVCPEHYNAVHFHEDDLHDAAWETDFIVDIPDGVDSGLYAAKCESSSLKDYIPFVVLPGSRSKKNIAVVLPVYTYIAYGNSRVLLERDVLSSGTVDRELSPDPYLDLLSRHPEWGSSLYDIHTDASGVTYASWRRPLTDVRPDHTHSATGGPRNFSADVCLIHWLDRNGYKFDVITDQTIHEHGIDAVSGYSVVLTGSHPEYCTQAMLDALDEFTEHGGCLMYLGGNGFYWVTSVHPEDSGVIEVRRGHCGTRPWTSSVGELRHSTTSQMGGLWRHRGRPPNMLVGVGFTAQGWDNKAGCYLRSEASLDPKYSWIFDGVDYLEKIGDFGAVMNGAAGDEIDRHDPSLGGEDFIVLARSSGHSDCYCLVVEDLEETTPNVVASRCEKVRSDIVYRETPGGGAVFSVGSMAWVGALIHDDCSNNVSHITNNVLRELSQWPRSAK